MRRLVRDYGLSIVVGLLFLLSLVGAAISGWFEYVSERDAHATPATLTGDGGYLWTLLEQILQNWQSEFLALATLIALASILIHKGSPESKDGEKERAQRIAEIEKHVDRLVAPRGRRPEGG